MKEEWLPVVGWEGFYEVSNFGQVRSMSRKVTHKNGFVQTIYEKILKGTISFYGYRCVDLCRPGKRENSKVHRLVLSAFAAPQSAKIDTRHLDGDRLNNKISNLKYGTRQDNINDTKKHGRIPNGERHWNSKLSDHEAVKIFKSKDRQVDLAKKYNVSHTTIYDIQTRKRRLSQTTLSINI